MAVVTDDALCIRHWDWSETSQTLSLFARAHGIVRCVAKGSRREGSNYSGGLEVATRGEMAASIKTEGQLSNLTAWDLQEVFPRVRTSLAAFRHAMAMLDVLHHALQPLDPHPDLFDTAVSTFRQLESPGGERLALCKLLWAALSQTGHQPEIFQDAATGAPLTEQSSARVFSPHAGGLVDQAPLEGPSWRVRSETIDALRLIATGVDPDPDATGEAVIERAARLLGHYFREVFAVEPPALRPFLTAPDVRASL